MLFTDIFSPSHSAASWKCYTYSTHQAIRMTEILLGLMLVERRARGRWKWLTLMDVMQNTGPWSKAGWKLGIENKRKVFRTILICKMQRRWTNCPKKAQPTKRMTHYLWVIQISHWGHLCLEILNKNFIWDLMSLKKYITSKLQKKRQFLKVRDFYLFIYFILPPWFTCYSNTKIKHFFFLYLSPASKGQLPWGISYKTCKLILARKAVASYWLDLETKWHSFCPDLKVIKPSI